MIEPRPVVVEHDRLRHIALDWGGVGETLVLLHPNGLCAGFFDPLARRLTDAFRVIGVATEDIAGATVRTVILSGAQGAVFGQVGDTVAGGYRITTIDAAGADLTDPDGVSLRLSLTP